MTILTKRSAVAPKVSTSLAIVFFLLSAVMLLFYSGLRTLQEFKKHEGFILEKQLLIAKDAAKTVGTFIQENFRILETAIWVTDLHSLSVPDQRRILRSMLGPRSALRGVVLLDARNQVVTESSRLSLEASKAFLERVKEVLSGDYPPTKRMISPVHFDPVTSEPMVTMAIRMNDVFGVFQGSLVAELNLKFMWDMVAQIKVGATGYVYVADTKGRVIAFRDTALVLQGKNVSHIEAVADFMAGRALEHPPVAATYQGIMGSKVLGTYAPLDMPDWAVVAELPWEEAYRELTVDVITAIGITFVMATLSGIFGILLAGRAAVPVINLTETATRIAAGEMDLRAEVKGPREIAHLALAFNSMTAQLRRSLQDLEQQFADLKQTEGALRLSEERLRVALEGTSDGIWDWNVLTGQAYFSPRYYTMVGYEPDEFPASYASWRALVHPDDVAGAEWAIQCAIEDNSWYRSEFRFRAKDGEWCWILARGKVVESDSAAKALRMAGSHSNVTERRRAEEETRRLRNYLSRIINSMPSMLIGVDVSGRVTEWNAAAEKATGVEAKDALGQPLDLVVPMLVRHMDKVWQAMQAHTIEAEPKAVRLVNGQTCYEDITVYPLIKNGVEGAVIRVDDVTERVRLEEMMVQSEKMLSVGGLAAGMAHEINNPLGVILQSSQNVLRRVSPDLPTNLRVAQECGTTLNCVRQYLVQREILVFLEDIRQSGQRAAEIVANMLSFSRRAEGGGTLNDLAELLDRTLSLAASDYDLKKHYDFRQIEIVRDYQPEVPRVICQAGKIQQVFLNVLRNGAEAMMATREAGRAAQFVLRVSQENELVRVDIEDNGPGMDDATRKRVFEPFFTTKPPGSGIGLGLSVSYFIVTEQHGGTMAVESNPGVGTRFIIRLPMVGRGS